MENAKQNDITIKVDTALATIERDNPSLKGALPNNYYLRLQLDNAKFMFYWIKSIKSISLKIEKII